jgi:hypothetical protein
MTEAQASVVRQLVEQARWCARLGSPLSAAILERAAADILAGGPAWDVLAGHAGDRPEMLLSLRFLGSLHRLVLRGATPALARCYPSAGGRDEVAGAWSDFCNVLVEHRDELRAGLDRPVQTNEVGRAAALLGGFLLVGQTTGLPLRLLELGTSAGLNLRWDHYRYEAGPDAWGDPASPVRLAGAFDGPHPRFAQTCQVVQRRGCDAAPLDPSSEEDRLTLGSYVWADQTERLRLLDAALAVAQTVPAQVEKATAAAWLVGELRDSRPGTATVVFHSIVWQYLDEAERERVRQALAEAGARATRGAPLAWLRMEPAGEQAEVRLTLWPGPEERLLATSAFHGRNVHWLADDSGSGAR